MTRFRNTQWAQMDPDSRRHLRWTYRMMRDDGIARYTARMYLGSAVNAGYIAGMNAAMSHRSFV